MKLKRNKLLITLIFLLVILVSAIVLKRDSYLLFKNYLIYLSQVNPLTEKSKAQIFIDQQKLKINFKIAGKDKEKVSEFVDNLGAGDEFLQGIALSLDDESRQKLAQSLPLEVTLDFSAKRLGFSNNMGPTLKSSYVKQDIDFATESGKFTYKANSDAEFYLEAQDPGVLIKYAISSGALNLSEKFSGLFPTLSSLSKIQLTVNGKNINGEITLK